MACGGPLRSRRRRGREGRVGSLNKLTYTWKESGEVAYVKSGRLVYTVRDGKIVRYELEDLREVEREIAGAPAH